MKPRDYQLDAKRGCYEALRSHRSALVAMPTGTGKTVTFASIIADAVGAGRRVLVLAHREELLDQAADKIKAIAGCEVGIEDGQRDTRPRCEAIMGSGERCEAGARAVLSVHGGEPRHVCGRHPNAGEFIVERDPELRVVISSVFSMINRLDRFPADAFDLVVVDEAHRALARTYRDLLAHFSGAKVLGFTATPNRGDERALAQAFDAVAYDMTLADAITLGWLVPIKTQAIKLESLDLGTVRRRHGEFAQGELGDVMSSIEVLREAIEPAVEIAGKKQAIVFCVTRRHAQLALETALQVAAERSLSLPCAYVDGETPKDSRALIMDQFRSGHFRWLFNVEIATEGFDAPSVEVVIFLRPTMSRALYMQMGGRGTRPLPGVVDITAKDLAVRFDEQEAAGTLDSRIKDHPLRVSALTDDASARRLAIALSPKPHCLWLDFTDNSDRHDVASPMDLLGGDYTLPEQREAERLMEAGETDLLAALEAARAAHASRLAEAQARAGDPFALFGITSSKDRWSRPATEKQRAGLGPMPRSLDVREANAVLREMSRRKAEGLAMYEQVALLARLHHPVEPLRAMTRATAAKLTRALALRGWYADCGWERIYDLAGVVHPGSGLR